MRCEVLKQANETEQIELHRQQNRFLDHVRQFEEEIERRKQSEVQSVAYASAPVIREDSPDHTMQPRQGGVKSVKAKTYYFDENKTGEQAQTPAADSNVKDPSNFVEFYQANAVTTTAGDPRQKSLLREAEPNIVGVENSSAIKHSLENSVGPINIVTHSQKITLQPPEAIGRRST